MGASIAPTDRLFVPHRKRLMHAYVVNGDGQRELRIDYGLKEISFDEPHLFAFGERLVAEAAFTGHEAAAWGAGYDWDEIRPLLETLLDEGILLRGDRLAEPRPGGVVASRVPPSVCPVARTWSAAECEPITRELTGRATELGYLEAFVPVFRIAHPALDADGRQVGEANVYPPPLRLDQDTEWRVCQYPGSRYRDELPMNVTALKAMIKYWKPILLATLAVRAELQPRLAARSPWTIGELHVLSCAVLALPAFQLLQRGGRAPQPPIDPILSSLFRITDGIRMTTYDMLFSIEHTRRADEPLTAAALFEQAEHRGLLVSTTGVCAGPAHLIQEFLATAVDGVVPAGLAGLALPPGVLAVLGELPDAIDYALYGMQSWGVSDALWLAMSRAYEAVIGTLDAAAAPRPGEPEDGDRGAELAPLRDRLRADWAVLERLQITRAYDREVHWRAYQDGYERSRRASRTKVGPETLEQAVAPRADGPLHVATMYQLRAILRARFGGDALGARSIDCIADALVYYLRIEQAVLAHTAVIQDAINALLERARPRRPLTARDLIAYYTMNSGQRVFPYLFDSLEDVLGLHVACTAHSIKVADLRGETEPPPTSCASLQAGGQ